MLTKSSEINERYSLMSIGVVGKSIVLTSPVLLKDIQNAVMFKCGFIPEQLIETRVVSHELPELYETWAYDNRNSDMQGQTTVLSVILLPYPDDGGTDIDIVGDCDQQPINIVIPK